MLKEVGFELVFPSAWPSVFWHPHLRLLLAVYVDDFKMAGPKDNLAKGWELIGSRIDMDTPSPLGRYLGCEHVIKENCRLGAADHPFAHVFDKSIPDPAAKTVAAAPVQDFAEYIDEEGVYIRHHCQPRKALSAISSVEADAMQLGDLRCTEATAVNGSEMPLSWDTASKQAKLDTLCGLDKPTSSSPMLANTKLWMRLRGSGIRMLRRSKCDHRLSMT